MPRLRLFNPDNDMALAADTANFTPPAAGRMMRLSGAALPLWYGDSGDRIVIAGLNARWLEAVQRAFDIDINVYDHNPAGLEPAPWGWSKAARAVYARQGFAPASLPDDSALDRIRALSHRRTAAEVARRLAPMLDFAIAPPAVETSDPAEVAALASSARRIVKAPWSGAGRGLIDTSRVRPTDLERMVAGIVRRQGCVMVETAYRRKADFAMLFDMAGGQCSFAGYSVFDTDAHGSYTSNFIADEPTLLAAIGRHYPAARIEAVRHALPAVLSQTIGADYSGPLGVDMLVAQGCDGEPLLDATVELNLRTTMGRVALEFGRRHLADGVTATMSVAHREGAPCPPLMPEGIDMSGTRLARGKLHLTPGEGDFTFTVTTL